MPRRFLALTIALVVSACADTPAGDSVVVGPSTPADAPDISGAEIEEHMRVLSSDEYMGRAPGHAGGDLAADYIAGHFEEWGLEAPNGSYFQTVPMVGTTSDPATVSLAFTGPAGSFRPTYLDQFVLNAGDPVADGAGGAGELVFVGYGIDAPENDWNDFEGLDVRGKYLLILVNDPPAPPSEPDLFGGPAMTYYGRWTYKYEEAARRGALGALIIHETEAAGYPWSVVRGGWSGEQFALPPSADAPRPAGMVGWVSLDAATEILELAEMDLEDLEREAAERGFAALATGITVTGSVRSSVREVETKNVVGLLRGTARPDDYVTVTSHYDHFGIGEAVDGDTIYNGAYDNASGTALLMSMAHALARRGEGLERSVLFIATAAEEQGLLGAQWYAQSPLHPLNQTVAEINVDGANLWGETDDAIVQGAERSELGGFVRPRARQLAITLMPDAEPEKGFFFRSDHFPFAKAGVPALYVEHGRQYRGQPAGWGDQIQADYTANNYHAPSDEFSESFVFDGAVQQGLLATLTLMDIANSDAWPNWHEGQEFKAARDAMMSGRD